MNDHTKSFGESAKALARNPFEIIATFIVLVYGFASLVMAFAGSLTSANRLPRIFFLVMVKAPVLSQHGFQDMFT